MMINPKARAPDNRFGQDVNGMGSIGRAGPTSQRTIHSSLDRALKTIAKTRLTAGKLRIMNYIHYEELRPRIRIGKINMGMSHANLSGDNRPSLFGLDAEQQAILDQADRFAQKELYPLSARIDLEEWWPDAAFPRIGDNSLLGATIEEYGQAGLDLLASGRRHGAAGFARWNRAMALAWVAHDILCSDNIYGSGNEQQRCKYLPDLCSGRKVDALGTCDPETLRRCAL
jgi:hypothetical protein